MPRPVLSERLAARNAQLPPYAFPITEAHLDYWRGVFETHAADELLPR